jgi:hypothetical protein
MGRNGLKAYEVFLADPASRQAFVDHASTWWDGEESGELPGVATLADGLRLHHACATRQAAAAWFTLAALLPEHGDREIAFEVLAAVVNDPQKPVRTIARATISLLGWSYVAGRRPATVDELPVVAACLDSSVSALRRAAYVIIGMLRARDDDLLRRVESERQLAATARVTLRKLGISVPTTEPARELLQELRRLERIAPEFRVSSSSSGSG